MRREPFMHKPMKTNSNYLFAADLAVRPAVLASEPRTVRELGLRGRCVEMGPERVESQAAAGHWSARLARAWAGLNGGLRRD